MSTDVAGLIDRMLRTYLEPPDFQPASVLLTSTIDADDTALTIGTFAIPEDEELLRQGALIEVESELILVGAYDNLSSTCSALERGVSGTTAASHSNGARIKLSPPFPRQSVFEAVADNITTLYPNLWTVRTEMLSPIGTVAPMEDGLAADVVEVWSQMGTVDLGGRLVDFHPAVGGRAVILDYAIGNVWCKYRRRFGSATAETDSLEDLGVDPRWERLVVMGACADLFAGRDLPNAQQEWIGASLSAENVPVGTRANLAVVLANYRERLLEQARKEMRAEYRSRIRQRSVDAVDMGVW